MANHSDRGSARVPGYDDYGYGNGPVSPAPGSGPVWGDGYDGYSDPVRAHAEPPSGRASVPMPSAAVPQQDDGYDYEPRTVGRASVGKREAKGRATVTGPRSKPSEEELAAQKKRLKKKRRIRRWAIFGCIVAVLAGVGVVGVSTFWAGVPLPDKLELATASTVMYADGDTAMAGLGSEFRIAVDANDIPPQVKWAVIAAEDQSFYDNPGVDFSGVMRAFWNNVTGGETQGASTITQQYAGIAANMRDEASYGRKAREAVIAMKLDDEYTKDEILGFYLNVVYVGRGAYGIGAAAKAFFNKEVKDLTAPQAAFIAGQIKSPDGSFDPKSEQLKDNPQPALDRYHYVLESMQKIGRISPEDFATGMKDFPEDLQDFDSNSADWGKGSPSGFISHRYVLSELQERYGITREMLYGNKDPDDPKGRNTLPNVGGYKVVTTIDEKMQEAAQNYASRNGDGSVMKGQKKNLIAALTAIDPRDGSIKAYYGGDDGAGIDKAGPTFKAGSMFDEDQIGDLHPMGSALKIFTLSTAVHQGASVDSYWDGSSPREFPGRAKDNPVVNSGDGRGAQCKHCTLTQEVRQSLNTPMYAISAKWGSWKILEQAYNMGVTEMVDSAGELQMLKDMKFDESAREHFDNEISFGQYPISVKDLAAGGATIAANGVHKETHVVDKVFKDGVEVQPLRQLTETQAMSKPQAADVISVLSQGIYPSVGQAFGGNGVRPTASKTGTWERYCTTEKQDPPCEDGQNSNTAYIGFTPQLATAVWVGDEKDDNGNAENPNGLELYGSQTAGSVWKKFMETALKGADVIQFPPKANTGDINAGDGTPEKKDDPTKKCKPEDIIFGKCDPTNPGGGATDPPDPTNPGGGGNPPGGGHDGNNAEDGTTDGLLNDVGGAGGGTGTTPYTATAAVGGEQDGAPADSMSVQPYAVFQREYSISHN